MVTAGEIFAERCRDVVAWSHGPLFAEAGEDSIDVRTASGAVRQKLDFDPDTVTLLDSTGTFVQVRGAGAALQVTETPVDGPAEQWTPDVPGRGTAWEILDVVEAVAADGARAVAVTVETSEGREVLVLRRGAPVARRPAIDHHLLYEDVLRDVMVHEESRGPQIPLLHVLRRSTGERLLELPGTWRDVWHGTAAVEVAGAVELWELSDATRLRAEEIDGHLDDIRIVRPDGTRLLIVNSRDGADQVTLTDPYARVVSDVGRARICVAHTDGVGLHLCSTLGESSWAWLSADGQLRTAPGGIPAYPGRAQVSHRWLGRTPALVYEPADPPEAMLVALHGGPEVLERDELRWEGLYRSLLDDRVAVVALNYAGSVGYGEAHRRRPWYDWRAAVAEEVRACLDLADHWNLSRDRVGFLGGSFGASLALLACGLFPGLAGAVACSPLADLRSHVAHCAAVDHRYQEWYAERFPDADQLFHPATLTATGDATVIVIQGDADEVVSVPDVLALVDRARTAHRPWQLVVEPGMGHRPDTPEQADARRRHLRVALRKVLFGRRDER